MRRDGLLHVLGLLEGGRGYQEEVCWYRSRLTRKGRRKTGKIYGHPWQSGGRSLVPVGLPMRHPYVFRAACVRCSES